MIDVSDLTRRGWSIAIAWAIIPPIDTPTTWAASMPRWSSRPTASAAMSLIVYDERHYPVIVQRVTAARVKAHFAGLAGGAVVRYELPLIGALNFVVHGVAAGGVTRTLALDAHGKSLSSALLEMEIEMEES